MKDYEVYELKTPEEIDEAFAKTFGLNGIHWAAQYNQNAVTDFLEGLRGKRRIRKWIIELRNWNRGSGHDIMATVSTRRQRSGTWHGENGVGFSDYACHALMKAAIAWDQWRRAAERERRQSAFEARMASVT